MAKKNTAAFIVSDEALYVANTGRAFDRLGVISICRENLSAKGALGPVNEWKCSDEEVIRKLLDSRLKMYRTDPNQLREDANRESETKSEYRERFLWEMLQNADDAMAKEGSPSSALIGAKGLGFKSVLQISTEPEIHSGAYSFKFSEKLSREKLLEIDKAPPKLTFRLPHPSEPDFLVKKLMRQGFATVIRLPFHGDFAREETEKALNELTPYFLLLSQNLKRVEIKFRDGKQRTLSIMRQGGPLKDGRATLSINEAGGEHVEDWQCWGRAWNPKSDSDKRLSVAVCVPLKEGIPTPAKEPIGMHVFYPTEEEAFAPFLIHVSFSVRQDRNHVKESEYDKELLTEVGKIINKMTRSIPARSIVNLFEGVVRQQPSTNVRLINKKLHFHISRAVLESAFIPTLHGKLVQPSRCKIWDYNLGSLLNPRGAAVKKANLVDPVLLDMFPNLAAFGSIPLEKKYYPEVLVDAICDSVDDSLNLIDLIGKLCSQHVYKVKDYHQQLAKIPCWMTSEGCVRGLSGRLPMISKKPASWPKFVPVEEIHPELIEAVEGWSKENNKFSDFLEGRLLQDQKDWILAGLVPIIRKWKRDDWEKEGLGVLLTLNNWLDLPAMKDQSPYIPGGEIGSLRDNLAGCVRLPAAKGWEKAITLYANPSLKSAPGLSRFFKEIEGRGVIGLPPKEIKNSFKGDRWRMLLRYLGVSWEPKIRASADGGQGQPSMKGFYRLLRGPQQKYKDWFIEYFPESLEKGVSPSNRLQMIIDLCKASQQIKANYRYRYDGNDHRPKPFQSFVDYQLKILPCIPCKPSATVTDDLASAKNLYWPNKGIKGVTPEVNLTGVPTERRHVVRECLVNNLGVNESLPSDSAAWLRWANSLAFAYKEGMKLKISEPEVRRFYEKLIFNTRVCELKSLDQLVCRVSPERGGLIAVAPDDAVWIDTPLLAHPEHQAALLSAGLAIFPVMLLEGQQISEHLSLPPASGVVSLKSSYSREAVEQQAYWERVLRSREKAIRVVCQAKGVAFKAFPKLKLVYGLTLSISVDGRQVGERHVPVLQEDDVFLVSAEDKTEAVATAIASNISYKSPDLKYRFSALLRARNKDEIIEILSSDGIPPYRLYEISFSQGEEDFEDEDNYNQDGYIGRSVLDESLGLAKQSHPSEESFKKGEKERSENINIARSDNGYDESRSVKYKKTRSPWRKIKSSGLYRDSPSFNKGRRGEHEVTEKRAFNKGLDAESWLVRRVSDIFSECVVTRNERDVDYRESDIVVRCPSWEMHIEVKLVGSGLVYWSDLERRKAETHSGRYFMALLISDMEEGYRIFWSWDPCNDFSTANRRIEWVWSKQEPGPPLPEGAWLPSKGTRPPLHEPNRFLSVIEITDLELDRLYEDDVNLSLLEERASHLAEELSAEVPL